MFAKLEKTQTTTLQKQGPNTITRHTMGATINNESTTTEPPP